MRWRGFTITWQIQKTVDQRDKIALGDDLIVLLQLQVLHKTSFAHIVISITGVIVIDTASNPLH